MEEAEESSFITTLTKVGLICLLFYVSFSYNVILHTMVFWFSSPGAHVVWAKAATVFSGQRRDRGIRTYHADGMHSLSPAVLLLLASHSTAFVSHGMSRRANVE